MNHSQSHFYYEPLSSCPTHRYLHLFVVEHFCVTECHLARCAEPWESIFLCKAASEFLLVSDYQACRPEDPMKSYFRARETARQLDF